MIVQFTEVINNVPRPLYVDSDYLVAISTPNNAPPWGAAVMQLRVGMQMVGFLVTETAEQVAEVWRTARMQSGDSARLA